MRPAETHGHLLIDRLRLEYRKIDAGADPGIEQMPAVILLHEGLGCAAMWRDFPQRLSAASGAPVFAYSRTGYGGSSACALPRPLDYMQQEGEQVLPQVLDALGVRDCVLFGHSDGASIAALCAGAQADPRIRGLVLMAPHFFTEDCALHAIAQARLAFEQHGLRERLRKYHGDNVDCAFRGWNDAWLHAEFRDWNITHCLPRIRVPVLAIQGEQDPYGSEAQLTTLSKQCGGPVEVLLLPECAHSPFREQPQRTLDAVSEWLARLSIKRRPNDPDQSAGTACAHNRRYVSATAPENSP